MDAHQEEEVRAEDRAAPGGRKVNPTPMGDIQMEGGVSVG